MEKITSKNNEKIKYIVKVTAEASLRRSDNAFVLEGLRLCCDAALTGIEISQTFVTEKALEKSREQLSVLLEKSDTVYLITEEIAEKISDTKTSQGVFCLCKGIDKNKFIDKINCNGMYIAVENIQTPANLGAVARTAEALGLDGIIVSGGCDIYNPKAQRAAMGSLLRLPVITVDELPDFIGKLRDNGMNCYAAVPDSSKMKITEIDKSKGVVCIVGNEGNGITEETVKSCTSAVTIPMKGRAESLNAAAAAAVIMWEMVR